MTFFLGFLLALESRLSSSTSCFISLVKRVLYWGTMSQVFKRRGRRRVGVRVRVRVRLLEMDISFNTWRELAGLGKSNKATGWACKSHRASDLVCVCVHVCVCVWKRKRDWRTASVGSSWLPLPIDTTTCLPESRDDISLTLHPLLHNTHQANTWPKGIQEGEESLLTVTRLQPLPVDVKMQDAGPQQLRCMWREQFQGPTRCLRLPIHVLSHFNCARLFETPGASPHQAPLSVGLLQASILEWVAMPSSRGSSQPRDRTRVSCIAGRFFTSWATREASFSYTEEC